MKDDVLSLHCSFLMEIFYEFKLRAERLELSHLWTLDPKSTNFLISTNLQKLKFLRLLTIL